MRPSNCCSKVLLCWGGGVRIGTHAFIWADNEFLGDGGWKGLFIAGIYGCEV